MGGIGAGKDASYREQGAVTAEHDDQRGFCCRKIWPVKNLDIFRATTVDKRA